MVKINIYGKIICCIDGPLQIQYCYYIIIYIMFRFSLIEYACFVGNLN